MLATRWLGGQASDALTGDGVLLELLTAGDANACPAIRVRRQGAVSHHAMMSQHDPAEPNLKAALERAGEEKSGE
jgi:hypothetical protein